MGLRLFNTLGGRKEEFQSLKPGQVGLYACGVTVYDDCHLGHGRAAVVFDLLTRYLGVLGHRVTYVRNLTDIDDKILNRSKERGLPWDELARRYIDAFSVVMDRLGNLRPTFEPKATDHIPDMVRSIQTLIDKGFAYRSGSDVFFSVRRFPTYGLLSGKKIEELEVGARVEVDEAKQDPLDFVLWKGAKTGEPSWPAPFGAGRPGWHIECSTMSMRYLGRSFDIHGGGRDLIFPHHENERAQAEAETGERFVRFWMHNGFVNIESEKMSKSTGQFKYLKDILDHYDAETVRHFLLSCHYAAPLDYTATALGESARAVERVYTTLNRLSPYTSRGSLLSLVPKDSSERVVGEGISRLKTDIDGVLADDLNTAKVLGLVFEAVRDLNRFLDKGGGRDDFLRPLAVEVFAIVRRLGEILGIFAQDPRHYLESKREAVLEERALERAAVEKLIEERRQARQKGDFKAADAIRRELAAQGIELRDRTDGSTEWWVA